MEGLKFLVDQHKNCGGNVVIIAKSEEHFHDLTNKECGPIPGDDAHCERCKKDFAYDGNFWTEA